MGTVKWHLLHAIWLPILAVHTQMYIHTSICQKHTHTQITMNALQLHHTVPHTHTHTPGLQVNPTHGIMMLHYKMMRWWAGHFLLLACQEMSLYHQYELDLCCCHTSWFIVAWLPTLKCITLIPCCWKHQDQTRHMKERQQVYFIISWSINRSGMELMAHTYNTQRTYNLHLWQLSAEGKISRVL